MVAYSAMRKALESQYIGTCDIVEKQAYKKANKSTGFREIIVLQNQPCKLSFSRITNNAQGETAANLIQVVKVFMSPEINVKPGSKLIITQNGRTTEYQNSGKPAVYRTHQEIILELFEGWA